MNKKSAGLVMVGLIAVSLVVYFWPAPGNEPGNELQKDQTDKMHVRRAVVAGRFYPSSAEELKTLVRSYLDGAPFLGLPEIHGLVCPHAGYVYSGPTAGYSYMQLSNGYDTVILLGPTHYIWFKGASIPDYTHFETPLGLVKVSEKAFELKKNPLFVDVPEAHMKEHCLEVQLPFLQSVLTDFEIIPVVLGDVNSEEVASALLPYIDERTLVVASSDLSHYYPYEQARALDEACTVSVPDIDFEKVMSCEACGLNALKTLMYIAQAKGWQGTLLDYQNSGDTAGEKEQVVGYMAVAFYGESYLSEEEQTFLLNLARETLEKYLEDGSLPVVDELKLTPRLKEKRACFVTLNENGMLRGCIGNLTPEKELYKGVIENAVNAAVKDPRFNPVTYEELSKITLEISVLTLPEKVSYENAEDLLKKIEGKGVTIHYGLYRATFLPQVWEQLPNPEEFLSHLCSKAGLPSNFWKEGKLEVEVYSAQVFGEEEGGS